MTAITASSAQVIVLNASYEPLSPTTLDRAMALVLDGEAVIEEADPQRLLNHKFGAFPWPLIIRLLKYVKVSLSYGPKMWTKAGVLKRDGYRCGYCEKRRATTVDHIHPQSKGGKDTWENTVSACAPCNSEKADHLLKDLPKMTLKVTPTVPMEVSIRSTKKPKRQRRA